MYIKKEVLKNALVERGFSSVTFPGGGGNERRHTSTVLMWCIIDGELVFIVLPHRHIDPQTMSSVSETNTKDELPIDTAIREVEEETSIRLYSDQLNQFFKYEYIRDHHKYCKYFFTAQIKFETVKEWMDTINENIFEVDIGVPVLVTLSALSPLLCEDKTILGLYSKVALKKAVEIIHMQIPEEFRAHAYSKVVGLPDEVMIKKYQT